MIRTVKKEVAVVWVRFGYFSDLGARWCYFRYASFPINRYGDWWVGWGSNPEPTD